MATLTLITGYLICILLGLLGLIVLWKILDGSIDLSELLEETNGGASMSRFQLLVFTFVFALSLFLVIVSTNPPAFPNIPGTVLSLLGISGSSYLVSKGIQFSDPAGIRNRGTDIVISPAKATISLGKTQQFTAEVVGKPNSVLHWEVIAGAGKIDANGLYTAPTTAAEAGAPATPSGGVAGHVHATVQVTSDEFPGSFDLAVITISC
jgi:hypothetical protein